MTAGDEYRLDELGWLQFEQLCTELLLEAGIGRDRWQGRADDVRTVLVEQLESSLLGLSLARPALLAVTWIRSDARRRRIRAWARDEALHSRSC